MKRMKFGLLIFIALTIAFVLLLASGCGVEENPDYQVVPAGVHPFAEIDDHGDYLKENLFDSVDNSYDFSLCMECHGEDLHGEKVGVEGEKERSCYECHSPSDHQFYFVDSTGHSNYLMQHGWKLNTCYSCHSNVTIPDSTFSFGGSCSSSACHVADVGGPEACNTCHGNFDGGADSTYNWAPPVSLDGDTLTTAMGVGAHQAHLRATSGISAAIACDVCHVVPLGWDADGHIGTDPGEAELTFTFPADADSVNAEYNNEDEHTCAVYCHGEAEPVWTEVDGTWNACGSCHGIPPPEPHYQVTTCGICHSEVMDTDGNFIAPELHVDGVVEVY